MSPQYSKFCLQEHCHVNTNNDGDRFVGVRVDSNNAMIYFPIGYQLPDNENELRADIKNLIRILSTFTNKNERLMHRDNFTVKQIVEFPIQAYLNVIDYYLEHNGYYIEHESIYQVGGQGKINWSKTIKTQRPFLQNDSPIYLSTVTRKTTPNTNRMITRIHKYCVHHSFERIGWLFTINQPEQPDIIFDKNLFLGVLNQKLTSTNNDLDKKLFKSMIAMLEFDDNQTLDCTVYFGTDKFETIWERLIERYFGEKNKADYFPHAEWKERFNKNQGKPASALEPDSIMIYQDKYYVLDAKYYRYGVFPELGIHALPQSSDVNKQITYGEFVKNKKANKAQVFNAFIMPFNQNQNQFNINEHYGNVAEAIGDWTKSSEAYQKIQGIVVDTRYLLKNYDGNHNFDKKLLSEQIEKYFDV